MVLLSILLILPLLDIAQAKVNPKGLSLIKGCTCADRYYHQQAITRAIMTASEGRQPNMQYPTSFANREGFPFANCNAQQIFEFPLTKRDQFTAADPPGSDRVIYDRDFRFCSCVTHPSGHTGFVECDVARQRRKKKKKKKKDEAGTSGTPTAPPNVPVAK